MPDSFRLERLFSNVQKLRSFANYLEENAHFKQFLL